MHFIHFAQKGEPGTMCERKVDFTVGDYTRSSTDDISCVTCPQCLSRFTEQKGSK